MDEIEIKIVGWSKFNGRRDIKNPSWFRVEYRLLEDPDFFHFNAEEFKAWLYILAQACRKNSGQIKLNFLHSSRVSNISKKNMISAIQKLEELGLLTRHAYGDVTSTNANVTRQDRTGQDRTEQDRTGQTRQDSTRQAESELAVRHPPELTQVEEILNTRKVSYEITQAWLSAFPDAPWIISELKKAIAWESANPKRKKRDFGKFMTNWMNRGWDKRRIEPEVKSINWEKVFKD